MVKGHTVSVMNDAQKATVAGNFWRIACLPMMWKLLTRMIGEKAYEHNGLLMDEQKRCRKASKGTKDQLLIAQDGSPIYRWRTLKRTVKPMTWYSTRGF